MKITLLKISAAIGLFGLFSTCAAAAASVGAGCCGSIECCLQMLACCL